ncbi:uncharacterized protein LOC112056362 [Bicyclus anynana]|uniref:Uncharacterized protein LOC112056362 n=1 Tax=Bicyclus anynana TaxID=110368 RepID=A0A6J1P2Z5_BICAN|nr:uncharacterized protein LOC112056362 [Bicyclus anynana]
MVIVVYIFKPFKLYQKQNASNNKILIQRSISVAPQDLTVQGARFCYALFCLVYCVNMNTQLQLIDQIMSIEAQRNTRLRAAAEDTASPPKPNPKPEKPRVQKPLSVREKLWVKNVYDYVYKVKSAECTYEDPQKNECLLKVAEILDISKKTVYAVLREIKLNGVPREPKKSGPKRSFKDKLSKETFTAITQIVHQCRLKKETPFLVKVTQAVNNNPNLPNFSKTTIRSILIHLKLISTTRRRKTTSRPLDIKDEILPEV